MSSDGNIAGTLDASYYKGCGVRQNRERTVVLDKAYCVGNGQLMQAYLSDKVGTLNCMHDQQAVMITSQAYGQGSFGNYKEGFGTLKANGGDIGGGQRDAADTVGALCARDYKGVGNQYVSEGKCIVQRTNTHG